LTYLPIFLALVAFLLLSSKAEVADLSDFVVGFYRLSCRISGIQALFR
jgi:hypothetical protein